MREAAALKSGSGFQKVMRAPLWLGFLRKRSPLRFRRRLEKAYSAAPLETGCLQGNSENENENARRDGNIEVDELI